MIEGYTIGTVSALSGVSVDTIRFYERRGLTAKPRRNASGYRIFSQEMLARICFIKWGRDLGFSLQEVADLIPLFLQDSDDGDRIKLWFEKKIKETDLKMAELTTSRRGLRQVVTTLDGLDGTPADGPLLNHFVNPNK